MTLKNFMNLFRGLEDGYGEEIAGRIKNVKRPITKAIFIQHLKGKRKIGIYPLRRDNSCYFACLDFDGEGSEEKARKVFAEAKKLGITPIPERSSSGIGIHLWFFFKEKTEGWKARKLLSILKNLASFQADLKVELFPKQDFLSAKRWGNFVFLPQHGELKKEGKTKLLFWEGTQGLLESRIEKRDLNKLIPNRLNPRKKQLNLGKKTAVEILEYLNIELEQAELKGDELWAICPFHPETEPSFSINNKELVFHCFGCGESGYIDDLVELITGERFEDLAKQDKITETANTIFANKDGNSNEIADFNWIVKQLYRTEDDEILREIKFNQDGIFTALADGRVFANKGTWATFASTTGTYHWTGTESQFRDRFKKKDDEALPKGICNLKTDFGFRDFLSFDTVPFIIRKNKIIYPGEDEIFRTGEETLKISEQKDMLNFYPFLKTPPNLIEKPRKTKKELLEIFRQVYPDIPIEIPLGWTFANIYSSEIRLEWRLFPILFIIGANSSGKTGLTRNILGLWGNEAIMNVGKESTYVGVKRVLDKLIGIPAGIDDYRNEVICQEKDNLLRACFDSHAGFKGTKERREVYKEVSQASLVMNGEEQPADTGLRVRTLPIELQKVFHESPEAFLKLEKTIYEYSTIILEEIREKSEEGWEKLKEKIDYIFKYFFQCLEHTRQARIWAIPIGSYYHFFGKDPKREELKTFLTAARREQKARQEADIVSDFLITLDTILGKGDLTPGDEFLLKESKLFLRLKPCYHLWAERLSRRRSTIFHYNRLRTELEGMPFVIELNKQVRYPPGREGAVTRFVEIDLEKVPADLVPTFLTWI